MNTIDNLRGTNVVTQSNFLPQSAHYAFVHIIVAAVMITPRQHGHKKYIVALVISVRGVSYTMELLRSSEQAALVPRIVLSEIIFPGYDGINISKGFQWKCLSCIP